MRKRWCRRPETTRADFGTGSGPLSSLVRCPPLCQRAGLELAQLPVPAPPRLLTHRHTSSDKDATLASGTGSYFWQGLTLDGRLASGGGARSRAIWQFS